MTMTDPIADMLTRIRNANSAYHEDLEMPYSKAKEEIAKILESEGYIRGYEVVSSDVFNNLKIVLKYGPNKEHVISGIKRISKPGSRIYSKSADLPRVLGGMGIAIVSTSKGIITDRECRKMNLGGEVIAYVW
jgi:small subunit ribosomal protein S8